MGRDKYGQTWCDNCGREITHSFIKDKHDQTFHDLKCQSQKESRLAKADQVPVDPERKRSIYDSDWMQ